MANSCGDSNDAAFGTDDVDVDGGETAAEPNEDSQSNDEDGENTTCAKHRNKCNAKITINQCFVLPIVNRQVLSLVKLTLHRQ